MKYYIDPRRKFIIQNHNDLKIVAEYLFDNNGPPGSYLDITKEKWVSWMINEEHNSPGMTWPKMEYGKSNSGFWFDVLWLAKLSEEYIENNMYFIDRQILTWSQSDHLSQKFKDKYKL